MIPEAPMYTAYYDDSGSAGDTLAVVVAGFVAKSEQWLHFERNWNDSLRQFGIAHFHMRDFAHCLRQFARFKGDKEGREFFLRQLISHIKLRVTYTNAHAVLMDDYRKVNGEYVMDAFPPYALAGRTCIARVNLWAERRGIPKNHIQHVFEDGSAGKRELYQTVLRDHGVEVSFKGKNECVPLQAADLFAHETLAANRFVFEKGISDFGQLRYPIRQLESLMRDQFDWGTYTRGNLEEFCRKAGLPRRDSATVSVCSPA